MLSPSLGILVSGLLTNPRCTGSSCGGEYEQGLGKLSHLMRMCLGGVRLDFVRVCVCLRVFVRRKRFSALSAYTRVFLHITFPWPMRTAQLKLSLERASCLTGLGLLSVRPSLPASFVSFFTAAFSKREGVRFFFPKVHARPRSSFFYIRRARLWSFLHLYLCPL